MTGSPSLHRSALSAVAGALSVVAACLVLAPPAFAGDPATSIKVNEVESEGPSDFVELVNTSATPTDVSGLVLKDNDDSRTLAIPSGTTIAARGFRAVDTDVPGGFALDPSDSARVFLPDGTTLIDSYTWTVHAATTYGRCPDGTGAFVTTTVATKGAANTCPASLATQPWPGSQSVSTVDQAGVLGGDVSGLDYEGSGSAKPGVLWAVDNGNSLLHRLVWDGAQWVRDTTNNWGAGKGLRYPDGTTKPDSEGVTITDAGSAGGVFVSSESGGGVSRPGVLRYDVSGAGTTLTATQEWNLTGDLPTVGVNKGAESVEWVPDSYLVSSGFIDQATGAPYNPATYPGHGRGLFFVGLEANGYVYAYALDQTSGSFTRVATFWSGFTTFGALNWDDATNQLWVVCDNSCAGRSRIFQVDTKPGATRGNFVAVADYARPTGMDDFNNEGFTTTAASECVGGSKPVFWADDNNDASHALRASTIPCAPAQPSAGWSAPSGVRADFNGDGFGDLAVGAPGENDSAGHVHVLYGSASGLVATGSQLVSQATVGVADAPEPGDQFGAALAAGDVNGDGKADLVVGVPGENAGGGSVHVLLGSASGVTATGSKFISQNANGVQDTQEAADGFGSALAVADFGGTSADDVAIGIPGEDTSTLQDTGAVQVLFGSASGISLSGGQFWSQGSSGIASNPETGDRFGASLAAGNLMSSTVKDLAVGAPGENTGAGAVHVVPGAAGGLTATGSQIFTQNTSGVLDSEEPGDAFGSSLAVGAFGGGGFDDLAVGVPSEDVGTAVDAGAVQVLPGASGGVTLTGQQLWTQSSTGIFSDPESGDLFGAALATGELGNGPAKDLAVGVPGENAAAGLVHVIPGSATGLTATNGQEFTQNTNGVSDTSEAGDRFGAALTAANFGNSSEDDLAIGNPLEDVGSLVDAGSVNVLPGSPTGLTTTGQQHWSQATPGIASNPATADGFGGGLGR